jgi:hypothetical protein
MRIRTQIYIDKAQRMWLRRRAKARGGRCTMSELIREAIDFYQALDASDPKVID